MSNKRLARFSLATALALSLAASLSAAAPGLRVKPWVYDPNDLATADAAWVTHQGLTDAGGSDHALYLAKNDVTSALVAAGATIDGVAGLAITELGFDIKSDQYCGAGAPRINVYTSDDVTHFFGCIYGSHTADSPATGWTRVRFTGDDGFPPLSGDATVVGMDIVMDEGPYSTLLDNIDVNGTLIGKPGLQN
jgi:hypothetical protein